MERSGSAGSESTIRPALARIFRAAPGRILIATFSSNIHRIQQILSLASEFGRYVVLVGRSMTVNTRIAAERGYLEVPPGILVDIKDMNGLPDDKVLLLSTGSQGEPMSALSLMAYERHKYLKVKQGDLLVFSSRFIPGNEKAINHIINEFSRRGADVEYEKVSHVHVSGHAASEELRSIMRIVRPHYFMPVHGEYRHLRRHARMAVEEGIPQERVLVAQDGDMIEISREGMKVVDHVELKRVFVDGKGVGDVGTEVLRERRVLSEVGLVTVVLAVQGGTGEVVSGPEVFSRGLTYEELEPELLDGTRQAVERLIAGLDLGDPEEWEEVRDQIRLAVRRHINRILRRKPLVQTIILQI
ncbi:MAG: ribonuclease J [Deltaproteobacteria bacterium]